MQTKLFWYLVQCLSEEPGNTPHDGLNREASLTFSTLSMFSTRAQGINFVLNRKISCLISRRNLPLVLQVKVFNLKNIIQIKNRGKKILKHWLFTGKQLNSEVTWYEKHGGIPT